MDIEEKHFEVGQGKIESCTVEVTHVMADGKVRKDTHKVSGVILFGQMKNGEDTRFFTSSGGHLHNVLQVMKKVPEMLASTIDVLDEMIPEPKKDGPEKPHACHSCGSCTHD